MTTLEILAPYLPYGIEVEACSPDGFRALFTGISDALPEENPVHVRTVEDGWTSNSCWPYEDVLPVLRSFADLCTPLEDGTVPAVTIANIDLAFRGMRETVNRAELRDIEGDNRIFCYADNRQYSYEFRQFAFTRGDIEDYLAKELRRLHFAVGLTPDQYIRKDA